MRGPALRRGLISWALLRQSELLDLALQARPRAVLLSFGELRDDTVKGPMFDWLRGLAWPEGP